MLGAAVNSNIVPVSLRFAQETTSGTTHVRNSNGKKKKNLRDITKGTCHVHQCSRTPLPPPPAPPPPQPPPPLPSLLMRLDRLPDGSVARVKLVRLAARDSLRNLPRSPTPFFTRASWFLLRSSTESMDHFGSLLMQ